MNHYLPIESILHSASDETHSAMLNIEKNIALKNWIDTVCVWRETLSSRTEQTWALFHNDNYEFSAILFALWSLDKTVCLPSNKQPALIADVAKDVDGFIGST